MNSNTIDCPEVMESSLEAEVDRLGDYLMERFPAEAANADMGNQQDVVRLAMQLVDRLWRWEH